MDRIRENEARLPKRLREQLAVEAAGGDEVAEGDRTNIDSEDVSRWGQEGNREHQGSRLRSKGMGFSREPSPRSARSQLHTQHDAIAG